MLTGGESLCCSEIPKVSSKVNDANCQCITEHYGFEAVCLNVDVVMTAIYQYIEDKSHYTIVPLIYFLSTVDGAKQMLHIVKSCSKHDSNTINFFS